MRLKRAIKCVLCTVRMQLQYVCAKRWFENFRSRILSVKDCQPTEIDTDKVKVLHDKLPKTIYVTV